MPDEKTKEPVTKKDVIIIVGSMMVGVFGIAMVLFTLIADHKVSQMEARLVDKFALVREIEAMKARVVGVEARMDYYHQAPKTEGGP